MRLLIIGPRGISGHEGGVEKYAEEFVKRAGREHSVSVLCLKRSDAALPPGVEQIIVPASSLMKTDKGKYLIEALRQYATRSYDRVFILGMNFGLLILPLRMMFWRKARIVIRSGSIDYQLPKWGRTMRTIMRGAEYSMRFAHDVIAVSPSIQRHLDSVGIQSVLIRNGVGREMEPAPVQSRRKRHIIAVGRVTHQKNYAVLVDAAELLGSDGPTISVIGGADLSAEFKELAERVAAKKLDRFVFEGALPRDEVLHRMRNAALYVNCSLHEGMSNAVLEAIQCGSPILLSDIEANRDLKLPDRFYFPVNDPAAFAARIEQALSDPDSFVVDPELFEEWDAVIDQTSRLLALKQTPGTQLRPPAIA